MSPTLPFRIVSAKYQGSASTTSQLPAPIGIEIAFAGRSNVGKSSLLNALLERRSLARTSRTPGCTRLISFFEVKASDGSTLTLVDLPGYGYARRSKSERQHWGSLIETYLLERPTLRAVAILVDIRRGLEPEEEELLALLAQPPRTSRPPLGTLVVATKLDKLARAAQKPALQKLQRLAGHSLVGFSTKQPELRDQLWHRLRTAGGLDPAPVRGQTP